MYIIINIACFSFFFVLSRLSSSLACHLEHTSLPHSPDEQRKRLSAFRLERTFFVLSFLFPQLRENLERTPFVQLFLHLVSRFSESRFICVRGFCPRGGPFVRQLRIPFVVGNKIGSYRLFLVLFPGYTRHFPILPFLLRLRFRYIPPSVFLSLLLFLLSFFPFFLLPNQSFFSPSFSSLSLP